MTSRPLNGLTRRSFLGGSLAAGGLILAGCGSPSGSGASSSTLRVGLPTDVQLDALQRFNPNNRPLRRTVFDYLVDRTPDGEYEPALATEWEWSSDRKSLVLTLRDGVTYHSGRAFGPDDVIASVKAATAKDSGVQAAPLLNKASGIAASGKNKVKVTFDTPFAGYLDALAMLPVIDTETYADSANGKKIVGTGPFTWKSWTAGSTIEMAKYGSYWRDGRPYLDEVVFSVISDPQATLAAMRSGDIHLANQMIARDVATLAKDSKYKVAAAEGYDVYIGANTKIKPLDDVRVRQAIAYGLDRDRIAEQVYGGYADPSCVPWSADAPGVTKEQVSRHAYDVGKAKALLREAGASGAEIVVTSTTADPSFKSIRDIVQYGLEQIGLKVKPVTLDAAQTPQHMQAGDWPGLWIAIVELTMMGPVTALLTANPLRPDKNTHNFTPPAYRKVVQGVVDATTEDAGATAGAALTDYMLEQAFHNTVVQAKSPVVSVAELTGVSQDLTRALDLTDAKLSS